ncbi:hypothetical protein jhhlp_003828 [Lomentospora prolificans]|uniref:PH-response regulator protein palI/RIM9 n=1 Tax=Lomentospora prolificans TaxID=41688 RepID=A0A2N3N9X2_9PEZI|nr:hypothetical protein jhhlp_003828 [Lomentospora prolificans]
MLRPATPLSVLLFGAFALVLLAVISAPIISGIPLGNLDGVNFGVFGFCGPDGCTDIQIGYDPTGLLDNPKFDMPASVRDSLTTILIVHPVAAFLTLASFILAAAAHLHSASHSSRYLLALFIVIFIDFLVCLVAFVIDVLLFIPHLAWGSYIVLAATIMVALSGIFACAMRRTLISRKARKNRVAQNAEMSGENYYNREAQKQAVAITRQPTMPVLSGANGTGDALPVFASFENQRKDDKVSDEHVPLTQRSPTQTSPNFMGSTSTSPPLGEPVRSNSVPPMQQDQYGNPMGPSPDDYAALRRGPSFDQLSARGRGGMPPQGYRGRGGGGGGYGRGGYGPPRGGYGPPGRGGYGPPRGGYGPPPRGGPGGMMRGGGRSPYQNPNMGGPYDRRPSPADAYGAYGRGPNDQYSSSTTLPSSTGYDGYSSDRNTLPRAESPPPLPEGVGAPAVEMDASPSGPTGNYGAIRDSDTDVAGMVGLQQARSGSARPTDSYMSDGSKYSTEDPQGQYVPPRAAWNQATGRHSPSVPSPLGIRRPDPQGRNTPDNGTAYYEDVDPRYAADPNGRSVPQGRQPGQYQGAPGGYGRPTPQSSNPDIQNRGAGLGRSPPPGLNPARSYPAF